MMKSISMTIEKGTDQNNFSIKMKRQLSNFQQNSNLVSINVNKEKASPCKISIQRTSSV